MQINAFQTRLIKKIMTINLILSFLSFLFDLLFWYRILSLENRDFTIGTFTLRFFRFICLIILLSYIKTASLSNRTKFKIFSPLYQFLSYFSLIIAVPQYIIIILKVNLLKKNHILYLVLIGASVSLHVDCLVLSIIENKENKEFIKTLDFFEMQRRIEVMRGRLNTESYLSRNETIDSTQNLGKENQDDPEFKKEETIIIVHMGKEKRREEQKNYLITYRKDRKKEIEKERKDRVFNLISFKLKNKERNKKEYEAEVLSSKRKKIKSYRHSLAEQKENNEKN